MKTARGVFAPCRGFIGSERSGSAVAAAQSIRPMLLYHLVIDTQKQERRRPLSDEEREIVFAHKFANRRKTDRPNGQA